MAKTEPRRIPPNDPLEETQENPALRPPGKPGRGRWVALVIAIMGLLALLAWVFLR